MDLIATTSIVVAFLSDGNYAKKRICLPVIVRGTSDRAGSTFRRWSLIGLKEDVAFFYCSIAEGLGINLDLGRL
jgi:hypothetical protein